MTFPVTIPRVNNNDDTVKLVEICVRKGQAVRSGEIIARVETAKAVLDVEAPGDGFVLDVAGEPNAMLEVGSVLMWLGETADAAVPTTAGASAGVTAGPRREPAAKAKALLAQYGLEASQVPATGERLSVSDVESYVAARGLKPAPAAPASRQDDGERPPAVPGALKALSVEHRAMLATVTWHRDVAVAGYIEMAFDPKPWADYAQSFRDENRLLLDPVLPLMAWRLVELAAKSPRVNATIVGRQRYEYAQVNLGFTVQVGDVLYLTVTRDAGRLGMAGFVQALTDIQRRAAAHNLHPEETSDATVSFSSMARWKVSRHVPVLPPATALIVAHTVNHAGQGVLGASYDHRVLGGAEVAAVLRDLGKPSFSA